MAISENPAPSQSDRARTPAFAFDLPADAAARLAAEIGPEDSAAELAEAADLLEGGFVLAQDPRGLMAPGIRDRLTVPPRPGQHSMPVVPSLPPEDRSQYPGGIVQDEYGSGTGAPGGQETASQRQLRRLMEQNERALGWGGRRPGRGQGH